MAERKHTRELISTKPPELIHADPTTINDLLGVTIQENSLHKLRIGDAPIFPFQVKDGSCGIKLGALVNSPLSGPDLLAYLNQFAPLPSDMRGMKMQTVSDAVGDDWAFMTSMQTRKNMVRKGLEIVHAPENVPGFAEFRPHVELWLDALRNEKMINKYRINTSNRAILPFLYWTIDDNNQHDWIYKVDQSLTDRIRTDLKSQCNAFIRIQRPGRFQQLVPDTFAGIGLPAYVHPEASKTSWEKKIHGQEMKEAQLPVLNWQHRAEHFDKPLMQALEQHILK